MFKRIKQDKKIKTFKKINAKDLRIGVNNLDGNYVQENNYAAILFNKPIPKKRIPKFEKIFGEKALDDMSFDELKAYTKKIQENKKKYIRKYQKTERGKETTRIASQKYYNKKREEILKKKKEYYQRKKNKL